MSRPLAPPPEAPEELLGTLAERVGQRLTAPDLDPKLAAFIWDALGGIVPARLKDQEALEVAERLGLVVGCTADRVSQALEYSVEPSTHRSYLGPGY